MSQTLTAPSPELMNITQHVGERAGLRAPRVEDPEEIGRLALIDQDPQTIRWFNSIPEKYETLDEQGLVDFAANRTDHLIYVVAGSPDNEAITTDEVGKLQGWVRISRDAPERVGQIVELGLIDPEEEKTANVIEVEYAKLPTAPARQMASAVREVCSRLAAMDAVTFPDSEKPVSMVTAYVIPGNGKSVRVLEASGFELSGRVQFDDDAKIKDMLFVLNWQKLNEIAKAKADVALDLH